MTKLQKIVLFSGLGVGIIGIATYLTRQAKLLKNACYTVAGAVINEISFNMVNFTMLLNVKNTSDIDFIVTNQRYHVYVNGLLVAKIENREKIEVLARGRSQFRIDVKFNPQDLLRAGLTNIEPLLYDKERMIIELKGFLSFRAGIVHVKDFPVDEKLTLKELLTPSPDDEEC